MSENRSDTGADGPRRVRPHLLRAPAAGAERWPVQSRLKEKKKAPEIKALAEAPALTVPSLRSAQAEALQAADHVPRRGQAKVHSVSLDGRGHYAAMEATRASWRRLSRTFTGTVDAA